MVFKFALIAALCIAQGFAFKPVGKGPKGPCKASVSESAEEIPHEFEEAMREMDELRETVSVTAFEAYFKGNNPDVIVACFRAQRDDYMKIGVQMSQMTKQAAVEMAEALGENFEKYAKRAEKPIRTIAITMRTLPDRMYEYMKNKEFGKALEVMRESRRIVEENSKALNVIIREMAQEAPEAAKRAEEISREMRETARQGCQAVAQAFVKCVQEGGPVATETDSEVEEAPEQ